MKRPLLIVMLCLMVACGSRVHFDDKVFDEVVYKPRYATGFECRRHSESGAVLITSANPWQGAEEVTYRLLIDYNNHFSHATDIQRITRPAKRIICMSSSHIAMLDAIGEVERVVGVSGIDFISNPYIATNRTTIGDVGYDNNINYELLIALAPDLVLLYGVNAANSVENKLREAGIPFAYIGEYVESSPLGKAEWMVAIGEIVGCREHSIEVFDSIAMCYNELAASIKEQTANLPRPKVMLNTPYRDAWFLPSKDNYIVHLIEDAAGETFTTDSPGNSSSPIDIEQALLYTTQSQLWLNPSGCNSVAELVALNPKFADTPPVLHGQVWNNNARQTAMGGSDFWESGVVRPDLILQDLSHILHPELTPRHKGGTQPSLHYYKRLQ